MLYCCTVDIVTRKLPTVKDIKYPIYREQLLALMEKDQAERFSEEFFSSDLSTRAEVTKREHARIAEVLAILEKIKTPSASNIGLDGARAVWLIALHNWDYNDAGRIVLKKMKRLYYKDKGQVFLPGIPYLVDRIMIGSSKFQHDAKQLYGTQGWRVVDDSGAAKKGMFPIARSAGLADRRKKFCLAYNPGSLCRHYQ